MTTDSGRQRRRLLILTPQLPFPPEQGTSIRNYNLLVHASAANDIALLSFMHREHPTAHLDHLATFTRRLVTLPAPVRSMKDRLRTLLTTTAPDMARRLYSEAYSTALVDLVREWQPDIVQVEGIELASYGLLLRKELGASCPAILFDDHNAEYVLQKRAALTDLRHPRRWPKAVYSLIQWRRLARLERRVCLDADAVLAVSDTDAAALVALDARIHAVAVPNGVDSSRYRPDLADQGVLRHPAVTFTGKMDFRPNIDAMVWFCQEIWPAVRAALPEATLYIAGKSPAPAVTTLAALPGVMVTGYVEDIMPYFVEADAYVVPLRMGGGTRLKVLEAMAVGCPIVSTVVGAEGIDAPDDEAIIMRDEPVAFAEAVIALLENRARATALGAAAREFVVSRYDWSAIAPGVQAVYERLAP